jgi:hypothetical protein
MVRMARKLTIATMGGPLTPMSAAAGSIADLPQTDRTHGTGRRIRSSSAGTTLEPPERNNVWLPGLAWTRRNDPPSHRTSAQRRQTTSGQTGLETAVRGELVVDKRWVLGAPRPTGSVPGPVHQGRYRLRCVVELLWQPARVPAVQSGCGSVGFRRLGRAEQVDPACHDQRLR